MYLGIFSKNGSKASANLAVDASGMPIRRVVTKSTTADCREADQLIGGINAQYLRSDKACDSNHIIKKATSSGILPVIPIKKNHKEKRCFDKHLYKFRHHIENTFLRLKQWIGIATRYAKNISSFLAAIQIKCIQLLTKIS